MSTDSIQFCTDEAIQIESQLGNQAHVRGTRVYNTVSEADIDLRQVFDEWKPARSHSVELEKLKEGCIVDLDYRTSSKSVNTPYRIESLEFGEEIYEEKFSATDQKFIVLFEPIIQNASLVIAKGVVREYDDGTTADLYNHIYYKRPWNTPHVDGLSPEWGKKQFSDAGFEKKGRSLRKISIVADEILAPIAGFEPEIFSLRV